MTPEEKAEYRKKVQASFYVDQPVTVTGATSAPKVTTTSTSKKKKAVSKKYS